LDENFQNTVGIIIRQVLITPFTLCADAAIVAAFPSIKISARTVNKYPKCEACTKESR
jgi:hypothetical protein